MLPDDLKGPSLSIDFADPKEFLDRNLTSYPNLDQDFIVQICYEHPERFNELLPGFDVGQHCARRIRKTAGWIEENVRYENGERVDFWFDHFDELLSNADPQYEIFVSMVKKGTWPFPPVVITPEFATEIGGHTYFGEPYHLIEGTHRVSYLIRMLQKTMVTKSSLHELITLEPNRQLNPTPESFGRASR